jgi:hypothetical protein
MAVGTHTILVNKGLCDCSSGDLADLGTTVEEPLASDVSLAFGHHDLDTAEKTVDDLLTKTTEIFDDFVGNDLVFDVGTVDKGVNDGEEAGEEGVNSLGSG